MGHGEGLRCLDCEGKGFNLLSTERTRLCSDKKSGELLEKTVEESPMRIALDVISGYAVECLEEDPRPYLHRNMRFPLGNSYCTAFFMEDK